MLKKNRFISVKMISVLLFIVFIFSGCRTSNILLSPLPAKIKNIEGYASIKITTEKNVSRAKFNFHFQPPHRSGIDVRHILAGTMYQIVIDREEAYLIFPSKKAYWKGSEEEIFETFLGFRLRLDEMLFLFFNQDTGGGLSSSNPLLERGWRLEKDLKGRLLSGIRGELSFFIEEYIKGTPFAKRLSFKHLKNNAVIKISQMNLNSPFEPKIFKKSFLQNYIKKSWFEVQELLKD